MLWPDPKPIPPLRFNPHQIAFMEARRERLVDGSRSFRYFYLRAGRRGGKTRIGALATIEEAGVANTLHWVCAPTFPELREYCVPAIANQIPPQWIKPGKLGWSAEDYQLSLINGARIQFRSMEDPERARGSGLNSLWLDEVSKMSEMVWQVARPALSDYGAPAWLTTTPKGPDWVHEQFWERAIAGIPGYWAVTYKTIDNPFFTDRPEEIEEARATMSDEMFRQEYLADIVHFTGAIYGDLITPQIIDDTQPCDGGCVNDAEPHRLTCIKSIQPEWPRVDPSRSGTIALDPGADHPFAGVFLVATEAGLVANGEYCERERPAYDHAQKIHEMGDQIHHPRYVMDRTQKQMFIELAQYGLLCMPSESEVFAGIERTKSWFKTRRLWLPKSRVPKLIRELQGYHWADTAKSDGQKGLQQPFKKNDDLCDALRYALMSWPELPKPLVIQPGRDIRTLPLKTQLEIDRVRRGNRERNAESVAEGIAELYA